MKTEKIIALLEFDRIRSQVAALSSSPEAARILRSLPPLGEAEAVEQAKAQSAFVLERLNSGDQEPLGEIPDIGEILPKLSVEGLSLLVEELYALGIFVERGSALRRFLYKEESGSIPPCDEVGEAIFRVLDREGRLRETGEIRSIKRRIQDLRSDLERRIQSYSGTEEKRRMLQSAVPSQRDGRLVLQVKSNYRSRIRGIVHEVSSSGQTLFVEPEEVVEKNNDILIEERNLDAEIRRILRALSAQVASRREDLQSFHDALIQDEILRARARYSALPDMHFAKTGETLLLKQARHPLLGKTVALKTAGLLSLMNQWGLAITAEEGSSLPVFSGIYADIGDEQSLSQSLSTFSAHMRNMAEICAEAGRRSLVLLDELGSGTDPQEGTAIAMAILDHLRDRGSLTLVTTHHGVLKNYAFTHKHVENASVEFDPRTLSPTYRVVMGLPGESRALEIALQRGLDPSIVQAARGYLQEGLTNVSEMITELRKKGAELEEREGLMGEREGALRERLRQADLRELRLRQRELELKAGELGSLRRLLSESRSTLENLVRELREGEMSRDKTLKVKDFLSRLEEAVKKEDDAQMAEREELRRLRLSTPAEAVDDRGHGSSQGGGRGKKDPAPPIFAPGISVLHAESGRRGFLIRPEKKGQWLVEFGSLRMKAPEAELIPQKEQDQGPRLQIDASLSGSPAPVFELNLLGFRLDEALEALQRQIDQAVLSGLKQFSVVHGKGDGILQRGVHRYLKEQEAVEDYYFSRPEMGGFGRTEVILK